MVLRVVGILIATSALFATTARAQTPCWSQWRSTGAPYSDLDRSLQLAGELPVTPAGVIRTGWNTALYCSPAVSTRDTTRSIETAVLPALLLVQTNSAYPRHSQDGLRWSGRGPSASISLGAAARMGLVTAALAPVITLQQNESFGILSVPSPGLSTYGNYFHAGQIDLPQRFGASESAWVHPGQSFVRVDAFGAALGISTENLQWGPARRNPIALSSAAAGFPHVFLGTGRPLNLRFAQFTVEAIWGRLAESEYFDTLANNDTRLFAGLVATVTPKGSGLTLGFTRSYLRTIPPDGLSLADQILGPYRGIRDNPDDEVASDNQLLSVFFSWVLPEAGFEAYAEYARDDHWEDFEDLLMQPDHSRGYTVGVERIMKLPRAGHRVRVGAEATNLGNSPTVQSGRLGAAFYTHSSVRQGYTHKGQLLGAPIGPGADGQYVGVDYIAPEFLSGLYLTRTRYDNDVYYRDFAYRFSNRGHDTEWTVGLRSGALLRNMQLVGDVAISKRYNRGFVRLHNEFEQLTRETNVSITLGGAWLPSRPRSDR